MKYEKVICPTCLNGTSNVNLILAAAAKDIQVEFYDFGSGCVVAPRPDPTPNGNSYLADHIVGIDNPTTHVITLVPFTFTDLDLAAFASDLARGAEQNKTQTEAFAYLS